MEPPFLKGNGVLQICFERKKSCLAVLGMLSAFLLPTSSSLAGEAVVGPLTIETIGIISRPFGGHLAGNMEVRTNGFTDTSLPITCDRRYITTRQDANSFGIMVNLLTVAQTTGQPVYLRITDDPLFMAFAGRCSLMSVGLFQ